MTVNITANGKTLDGLLRAVELRRKELGELTSNSVTATMIRALESIRAKTRIVNPKKDSGFCVVSRVSNMTVGFFRVNGKNRPCIRLANGKRYLGRKRNGERLVVDRLGSNPVGGLVFLARDTRNVSASKVDDYYIMAHSESEARAYANSKHSRRMKTYKGLAKRSLGWLMHKVNGKGVQDVRGPKADRVAKRVNRVTKNVSGFDSGRVYIGVLDGLDYAAGAVDGGPAAVDSCVRRAVNGIIGQINTKIARAIGAKRGAAFEGKIDKIFTDV